MAEPRSAYGTIIAACSLEWNDDDAPAYEDGMNIVAVTSYETSPFDGTHRGWKVRIKAELAHFDVAHVAHVAMQIAPGDALSLAGPTAKIAVSADAPPPVGSLDFVVYLTSGVGALLDAGVLPAGAKVFVVVARSDANHSLDGLDGRIRSWRASVRARAPRRVQRRVVQR